MPLLWNTLPLDNISHGGLILQQWCHINSKIKTFNSLLGKYFIHTSHSLKA